MGRRDPAKEASVRPVLMEKLIVEEAGDYWRHAEENDARDSIFNEIEIMFITNAF
jgi:hypothetical protein